MIQAQVLVRLRSRDPAAQSAHTSLVARLGFGDRLVELQRARYVELELPGGDGGRAQGVRRILDETTLLANPNKERATATSSRDGVSLDVRSVLVWDREDVTAPGLVARIARAFPDWGTVGVRRGVLWTPVFAGGNGADAETLAKMADGSTRLGGLLANPHAEASEVFDTRIPRGFLFARVPNPTPTLTAGGD